MKSIIFKILFPLRLICFIFIYFLLLVGGLIAVVLGSGISKVAVKDNKEDI